MTSLAESLINAWINLLDDLLSCFILHYIFYITKLQYIWNCIATKLNRFSNIQTAWGLPDWKLTLLIMLSLHASSTVSSQAPEAVIRNSAGRDFHARSHEWWQQKRREMIYCHINLIFKIKLVIVVLAYWDAFSIRDNISSVESRLYCVCVYSFSINIK